MANNRELSQFANVVGYNGGNIGINKTPSTYQFEVSGGSANTVASFESSDAISRILFKDNSGEAMVGAVGDALTFYTSTNATERVRIDSSGNLQVSTGQFTVGTTASTGLQLINDGTFGTIQSADLKIRTAATERVRISTNGRVGINSTSPATALDIQSTKNTDGLTVTKAGTRSVFLGHNGSGNEGILALKEGGTTKVQLYAETNQDSYINSGDFGIGTDSPSTKLDVRPTAEDPTTGSPAAGSFSQIRADDATVGKGPSLSLMNLSGSKETGWRISALTASGNNGDLTIHGYGGGATYSERLRITADGKIGVGTASPTALIHAEVSSGSAGLILKSTATNGEASVALHGENSSGTTRTATIKYDNGDRFRIAVVSNVALDFETNDTGRMRLNAHGGLNVGGGVLSAGSQAGNIVVDEGIYINSYNGDYQIRANSAGSGSATLYIGNAAINTSSDRRLKNNIVDTTVDAAEELKRVRVVDFTWNDPSDTSFNNRNARGTWTGVIAQELVDVFPFAVNAPRKEEDLSIDQDSEKNWTINQDQLVPVLIKAFQQSLSRIETLETQNTDLLARVTALENP